MKLQLNTRGGRAAIAIVGAALVATGCGGSGSDGGATGAAKDAAALDFVPNTAVGYLVVDAEFDGDRWEAFDELATAFDADWEPVVDQVSEGNQGRDGADEAGGLLDLIDGNADEIDYEDDVQPWLQTIGAAIQDVENTDDESPGEEVAEDLMGFQLPETLGFVWFELRDGAAYKEFVEGLDGYQEGDEVEGFTTFTYLQASETSGSGSVHGAYNDDLAIYGNSANDVVEILEYDGDSIKDAEGVSDAIDEVEDDALATLVVSGEGVREAAKGSSLEGASSAEQLKDFQAFALSLSAEEDGFRLAGGAKLAEDTDAENAGFDVFEQLPGNTVLAIGGHDLGGVTQRTAESAGEGNQQVQQAIGAASAVLGVSLDDLAEALDGEFALALAADDEGLGAFAGGAVGAAMGGGVDGVDPGQLLRSGTLLLAFEETGDAGDTLDRVVGAVGGLTGSQEAPEAQTSGDFETKQLTVQGLPITTAASDEVAALSLGLDVFEEWGGESLGDSDAFTNAWEAAEGPDESVSRMWLDAGRIARLAGVEGAEDKSVGGMVGWSEADGDFYRVGAFLHVDGE